MHPASTRVNCAAGPWTEQKGKDWSWEQMSTHFHAFQVLGIWTVPPSVLECVYWYTCLRDSFLCMSSNCWACDPYIVLETTKLVFQKHFVCFLFPAVLLKFSLFFVPNNASVSGIFCLPCSKLSTCLHLFSVPRGWAEWTSPLRLPGPLVLGSIPPVLNTDKRSKGR